MATDMAMYHSDFDREKETEILEQFRKSYSIVSVISFKYLRLLERLIKDAKCFLKTQTVEITIGINMME